MNSVKTIIVIGILLGVGYWVYNAIHNQDPPPLPEGVPENWSELNVEMPDKPSDSPPLAFGGPGGTGLGQPSAAPEPVTAEPPAGGTAAAASPTAPDPPGFVGVEDAAPPYGSASSTGAADGTSPSADPATPPATATVASPPQAAPAESAPAGPAPQEDDNVQAVFRDFMAAIQRDLDEDRLTDALTMLSRWYENPLLPEPYHREITDLLDQIAGVVIYSREHRLLDPYVVRAGETLASIAQMHHVPEQLLAKINAVPDPSQLLPGQVLKVVRGPFRAVVDLDDLELTLMLGDLYAGRFPIGVGRDVPQLEGTYEVQAKVLYPVYRGPAGSFDGHDPNNPLGDRKLDLDGRIAIHGTNDPRNVGATGVPGTICLAPKDIEDVYDILSVGSQVVIRR